MKIVLFTPSFNEGLGFLGKNHFVCPSIGLGIIAQILISKGHHVVIKDPLAENLSIEATVNSIVNLKPDIVGMSVPSIYYQNAQESARMIKKKNLAIKIIVGGTHFYSNVKYIMENDSCFDFACVGEGDYVIDKLIDCNFSENELPGIDGLVYRTKKGTKINRMSLNTELDNLPLPAYQIYPVQLNKYKPAINNYKRLPNATMLTSRGCPSRCVFCQGAIYNKNVRFHSAKYVINHIKFLVKQHGIRDILFFDDIFTMKKSYLYEVCDLMIKEKLDITWACFIKVNKNIDENILKKMKKAGCWLIMPGVESGSPKVLKLIKKDISLDEVQRVCKIANKLKIQVRPSFMLGNIGETKETLQKTIDFALSLPVTHIGIAYFTPLPGTPAWENISEYGTFDKKESSNFNTTNNTPPFIPKGIEIRDLNNKMEEFYFRFYFRFSMVFRHLRFFDKYELFKVIKSINLLIQLFTNRIFSKLKLL